MNITELLLDNYNRPNRKLKELKAIIIHWTANTNRGANAIRNRNYFNKKPYIYRTDRHGNKVIVYASAHYVVDDTTIVRCVPDDEVAYHCGASWSSYKPIALGMMSGSGDSPNNYTIGIEMCVNSDSDFIVTRAKTIELTRYLMQKHQLTVANVFRHFDITGKDCPKMMLDNNVWEQFLRELTEDREIDDKNPFKLKVNVDELNVRKGPGTNHPIVRKLKKDDLVNNLEKNGTWFKINANEWIHAAYVDEITNPTPIPVKIKINTASLNVRTDAGTQYSVVRKVKEGEVFELLEEKDLWCKIGDNQWVHSHYVLKL